MNFTYVDVKTKGFEGCINLFYMAQPIALITDRFIAERIKLEIPMLGESSPNNSFKVDAECRCECGMADCENCGDGLPLLSK